MNSGFIRLLDCLAALALLVITFPIMVLIFVVGVLDTGSPIFIQQRVGRQQKPFKLIKFRTMALGTQSVATHLAAESSITRFGAFLRKTKLDELPQVINVLKGEMSFVGPRPGLFNQEELLHERSLKGVYAVRPGITGLAQVQSIDMSTPKTLAETDAKMIESFSLKMYFSLLIKTFLGAGSGDRVAVKK